MRLQKAFTLIELMIVVAIIGILAAVAIPAYQDYIARSQVNEAVYLIQAGKTPFSEYYSDKGMWPSTASDVMGTLSGKYVSNITITTGAGLSSLITLSASLKSVGVNASIQSATLDLSSVDGKVWDCRGGSIASKYRPSACR